MRRAIWGGLVLGVLASVAGAGGWRELVGASAPEISAARWLNAPEDEEPSLRTLKGRAWLLCFMGAH
jgi:hypothetical protein